MPASRFTRSRARMVRGSNFDIILRCLAGTPSSSEEMNPGRGGAVGSDASAVTCSGRRWQWILQQNLNSADDAVDVTTHDSQQGSSYSMSVNSDVICGLILFFIYVSPLGL